MTIKEIHHIFLTIVNYYLGQLHFAQCEGSQPFLGWLEHISEHNSKPMQMQSKLFAEPEITIVKLEYDVLFWGLFVFF